MHFNVHIDPTYIDVRASDLQKIIYEDITLSRPIYFGNLTIDAESLEVKENLIPITSTTIAVSTKSEAVTQTPTPPRKCSAMNIPYCNKLTYNITTYPNILGHANAEDVKEDFIAFRELVDAECYRMAYEFVCQVLQPACKVGDYEDEMILPCRSFCRDFIAGCGSRLLSKYKNFLDCSLFPEFGMGVTCLPKPGTFIFLMIRFS